MPLPTTFLSLHFSSLFAVNARCVSGFCCTVQALPPVQYASLASTRMPKVCRTKYSEMRSCKDLQMTRNVAGLAGCCLLAKHIKHTRAETADATGPRRHMHSTRLRTMFLPSHLTSFSRAAVAFLNAPNYQPLTDKIWT